jgi:Arc/MetJ-type ribon-helix-helix transcriptional regulator
MNDKPTSPLVALRMPAELLEQIDELAHSREFVSRSDVIRTFVRDALRAREQRAAA